MVNICELGHKSHTILKVLTKQGEFYVYDSSKYQSNYDKYCTGRDVVSETLILEGQWEPHDSKIIKEILEKGDPDKKVIDFGCHIGWYTIMAAKLDYQVMAIDGDLENLNLLKLNAGLHNVRDKIEVYHAWVDQNFKLDGSGDIELIKIDLEGNEQYAIEAVSHLLDRTSNLYVEISPVFNGSYSALIDDLTSQGFKAFYPNKKPFDGDLSLSQINLWFKK